MKRMQLFVNLKNVFNSDYCIVVLKWTNDPKTKGLNPEANGKGLIRQNKNLKGAFQHICLSSIN